MRKTKVIGFSVPPEVHKKFLSTLKKKYKTKSEFFREVLESYYIGIDKNIPLTEESDFAQLLKFYWDLRAKTKTQIIVIGLGVIEKDGKILIGLREEKNKWIENLTWVFPGGDMKSLDFAGELTDMIKKETNIKIKVQNLISTRIHPDSNFKNVQIVALYFHCVPVENKIKEKPGSGLTELKWVKPFDVFKHFQGSVSDDVTKFLAIIEKAK